MSSKPLVSAILCLAAAAAAQGRVRAVAPAGAGAGILKPTQEDDYAGVPVEMFENRNIDLFLRKAESFLKQENWSGAISVLQDVVEGRTTVAEFNAGDLPDDGASETGTDEKNEAGDKNAAKKAPKDKGSKKFDNDVNAADAVFSSDGRLYRPVRRLCQGLLSTMPEMGIELYRQLFEVQAEELYREAVAERSISKLETVAQRFFITDAAGRAMWTLGDLLMDQGRFRGAIQIYRDLLEAYPAESRRKLEIRDVWLRFKIALCLRMLGEKSSAREELGRLAQAFPDDSIRLMGELETLADLPDSALFDAGTLGRTASSRGGTVQSVFATGGGKTTLVPLWEFRFEESQPYRQPKTPSRNTNRGFVRFGGGVVRQSVVPRAQDYVPGTSIAFEGGTALFMDHNRIRRLDALSGVMNAAGEGVLMPPKPKAGAPRPRLPVYDWATMPVVSDAQNYYTVHCNPAKSRTAEMRPILVNHLEACDRTTLRKVWSSKDWKGDGGYNGTTFLAAPTVFGERLVVPVLKNGVYGVQCLLRRTGEPQWYTRIHAGGTRLARAPGTNLAVSGGNVFCLTNAGAVAAIDAYTGDTRWIRRYERRHPLRKSKRAGTANNNNRGYAEVRLDSANSRLLEVDGLLILSPVDGDVVMALDVSTGEPVWMFRSEIRSRDENLYRRLLHIVGYNSENLYLQSKQEVLCVGLRSGLRKWRADVPADVELAGWRGRGLVTEDVVVLPGTRHVLQFDAVKGGEGRRVELPEFSMSQDPLAGPANLFVDGAYFGVTYEGGIEVYSSSAALAEEASAANDLRRRSRFQEHAGDLKGAMETLIGWLDGQGAGAEANQRRRVAMRVLDIATEVAEAIAANGDRKAAVAILDRCGDYAVDREVLLRWHLARLEFWKQVQDLEAYEREQLALYGVMEGRK